MVRRGACATRWTVTAVLGLALLGCEANPLRKIELPKLELPSLDNLRLPQIELPEIQTPDIPRLDYVLDIYPQYKLPRLPLRSTDAGIGGYTGPIGPITQPVMLRLNPPPRRVSFFYRTSGARNDFQFAGDAGFGEQSGDLALAAEMLAFRDERTQRRSVRPPLASARLVAARDGQVRGLVVDYPVAKRYGGDAPERGSRENDAISNGFRDLIQRLPAEPVAVGDSLPLPGPLVRFLAQTAAPPESNTLKLEVIGIGQARGRATLLAQFSGAVSYASGSDRVSYAAAGHALLDLETGLLAESLLRVTASGTVDGRRIDSRVLIESAVTPPS
jgi:hypothetical protein